MTNSTPNQMSEQEWRVYFPDRADFSGKKVGRYVIIAHYQSEALYNLEVDLDGEPAALFKWDPNSESFESVYGQMSADTAHTLFNSHLVELHLSLKE